MATKTLTITEDAYRLLADRKQENESFSQEIKRILTRKPKKNLMDYFGIISKEEGNKMLEELKKSREIDLQRSRDRSKMFEGL